MSKFTLSLILFGMLSVHAEVFSQSDKEVKISMFNVSLKDVFWAIEKQTDFTFMFHDADLEKVGNVDVDIRATGIEDILHKCLKGTELSYVIQDAVIVIKPKEITIRQQQVNVISGQVLDVKRNPIPGVTVKIKDSNTGTATNNEGNFSLPLPSSDEVFLEFSFIGMKTHTVKYTGQSEINVVLLEDIEEIEEVVITGMFNKSRESYTGAVKTIDAKELKRAGNRNLLTTIRNIDPSFNIMENINIGSDPNQLPDINIRGNASLDISIQDVQTDTRNMTNLPLIIMDGFEVSLTRMMDLDQNNVETITILKDASATSLYGTRGANGVVVITTRRPEPGKLLLSYTGGLNIEAPDLTSYNLMNSREKLQFELAAGLYDSPNTVTDQQFKELYNFRMGEVARGVDTYWLKYPVRTGVGYRNSLRIEGGADDVRYAINISNNNTLGVLKGSHRDNFNGDVFLSYQLNNLIFQNNLIIAFNKAKNSPYESFSLYTKVNSYYKPYDDEGNIVQTLDNTRYSNMPLTAMDNAVTNPLWNALLPYRDESKYTQIQNNFAIEWKIFYDFTFRGKISFTKNHNRSDKYISSQHTKFINYTGTNYKRKGEYTYGTGESFSYETSLSLNFSKTINDLHLIFAAADYSMAESKSESYSIKAEGISNPNMDFLGMASQYEKDGRPSASEGISRRVGGTLNANYTYDRKYFVDISGKLEGSSQFGSNDRVAPFWSAGLGWNIHHEKFMQNQTLISSARVRFSYGVSGSQNFSPYQAITSFKDYGNKNYNGWYGVYLLGMGNEDLSWQTTYQQNIGLDLDILTGKIRLTADYYSKQTDDMISDITLPLSSGFSTYKANIGKVSNKGLEISLTAFPIRNYERGWTWSVGGTLAHNKNKIKKISNSLEFLNDLLSNDDNVNPSFLYKEGQSMNTLYAVKSMGIDPSNGLEIFETREGNLTYEWDAKDMVPCGVTDPKIWGNLNTTLMYKNLSLTALFTYRHGAKNYNQTLLSKVENIYPYDNADRRAYYDRWKSPGEHARYKSVQDYSETKKTSRFIMDESTLECNNISVQYDLYSDWLKNNLYISYLSISGYMEDVFRISTIKKERGLDYPFSRKFSFSLTLRF